MTRPAERCCLLCGRSLEGKRADALYCNPSHRRKGHRVGRTRAALGAAVRRPADGTPRSASNVNMPMQPVTTARIPIYLPHADAEKLRAIADEEGMTASSFLRRLARRELRRADDAPVHRNSPAEILLACRRAVAAEMAAAGLLDAELSEAQAMRMVAPIVAEGLTLVAGDPIGDASAWNLDTLVSVLRTRLATFFAAEAATDGSTHA